MISFDDGLNALINMGLADVILPFILVFTIVFAVMEKMEILGKNRKIHAAISFVMGLSLVVTHVMFPNDHDPVNIINNSLPNVSVIVIAVVAALIILGVFGKSLGNIGEKSPLASVLWILSFGIVIFIFGKAAGWWGNGLPSWLGFLNDPDTLTLIVIVLVFALIIRYIMKEDRSEEDKKKRKEEGWANRYRKNFDDFTR